ncbi:MAG: hypothetical protein HQK66_13490 [Desulfamplus sp.]|nr:hypothetical protein [Desulfamplus sp.]
MKRVAHKNMAKNKMILVFFMMVVTLLPMPIGMQSALGYETSPRISDREIVESLAEIKEGQRALNKRIDDLISSMDRRFQEMSRSFDKRLEDMSRSSDKRFEAMDRRFEEMNNSFDKRLEEMNRSSDKRFEAMDRRFEEMHSTMLTLYTSTMALVIALIGYLIWDRRSVHKPLKRKVDMIFLKPSMVSL